MLKMYSILNGSGIFVLVYENFSAGFEEGVVKM